MLGSRQFAVPQFDLFSSGTDLSCEPLSGFPNLLALEIFFFKKNVFFSPTAPICGWCVHARMFCVCARTCGSVCAWVRV